MNLGRSENRLALVWPLVIILLALFWLLDAAGSLPAAVIDLAGRAWPIALVALGLALLLGRRVRFGNTITVGVCVILVGAAIAVAYNQQSTKLSSAYQMLDYQPKPQLGTDVKNISLSIDALITQIEVAPAVPNAHVLTAEFSGSQESRAELTYTQNGAAGAYAFHETQVSALPMLQAVGKGKLKIQLPAGVTIDQLTITGREGDLTFDTTTSEIKKLSISMGAGNVAVKISDKPGLIGDLKTGRGDVTLEIPKTAVAQIQLLGGGASNPDFNNADYLITRDNFLKPQRDPNNPQIQLSIDTNGKITVR